MLEVIGLSKRFADKKLFENVSLKFINKNLYGVIGANGAGKSTFLNILSGLEESSEGRIQLEKGARLSILEQQHDKYDDENVTSVVMGGYKDLYETMIKKDAIYMNPDSTSEDFELAGELEEKFGNMGGYSAESDSQKLLSELRVPKEEWDKNMSELKSGNKIKVLLARALFGSPDVLIMDEPTNHLDMQSISWLEKFLMDFDATIIVVSHDTDFLDSVCTHIVDIDFQEANIYTGNYSFWKQSSQLAFEMKKQQNSKKEDQMKKLKEFIARFSANASKSTQATSRRKTLEKISLDEIKPSTRRYPYIKFEINKPQGKDILTVDNISYSNEKGETVFKNLSFKLLPGDKLAILGMDDIAKTRLLEILAGEIKPTSGEVKWGQTIAADYVPINNASFFENDLSLLEWLSQWTMDNLDSRMRSFLGRMLFNGDAVFKKAKITSGGEKVRLMLARAMLRESNALIFDQPLDHLDTESIDSFTESLEKYEGTTIFTTYNKGFAQTVANSILEVGDLGSLFFRGSIEEYLNDENIQSKVESINS